MKKNLPISWLAFLIFSIICISFPANSAAASLQDDRNETPSFLQLTATGPEVYGNHAEIEKSGGTDVSHSFSIPVNGDLNAFFGLTPTNIQEIAKKDNAMDFRSVFGFRITLR